MEVDDADIAAILSFWFGTLEGPHDVDRSKKTLWWRGKPEIDAEVARRFGPLVEAAIDGHFEVWTATARGSLALVILLDQLARNVYRGTPRAFAGDTRALEVSRRARASGQDRDLRLIERAFLYMPMMHAEDVDAAQESIEAFEALSAEIRSGPGDAHPDFLSSARQHAQIVDRFGRYPHRNAVLGRSDTPDERAFLDEGGSRFGQRPRKDAP